MAFADSLSLWERVKLVSPLSLWERIKLVSPLSLWERVRVRAGAAHKPTVAMNEDSRE